MALESLWKALRPDQRFTTGTKETETRETLMLATAPVAERKESSNRRVSLPCCFPNEGARFSCRLMESIANLLFVKHQVVG